MSLVCARIRNCGLSENMYPLSLHKSVELSLQFNITAQLNVIEKMYQRAQFMKQILGGWMSKRKKNLDNYSNIHKSPFNQNNVLLMRTKHFTNKFTCTRNSCNFCLPPKCSHYRNYVGGKQSAFK